MAKQPDDLPASVPTPHPPVRVPAGDVDAPKKPKPVKPVLTAEEFGKAAKVSPHSKYAIESAQQYGAAKEALERVDAEELFSLYERAIKERSEIMGIVATTAQHFIGNNDEPRRASAVSTDVIGAMERVALAAIDLAKSIALAPEEKHP
jgi:hypothetical protein